MGVGQQEDCHPEGVRAVVIFQAVVEVGQVLMAVLEVHTLLLLLAPLQKIQLLKYVETRLGALTRKKI